MVRHEIIHHKDKERNFFQGQLFELCLIKDSNVTNCNNRIHELLALLKDHQNHSFVELEASIFSSESLSINANSIL